MATGQAVVEQEDVGLWFWCYKCEIAWPDQAAGKYAPDNLTRGQVCPKCHTHEEISSYYDNDWHEPEGTIV